MIPCCFHPTRVIVIDDSDEFLTNLNRSLTKDFASYHYFTAPQKALQYLNEEYHPNPFTNRYIENVDEEDWEHRRLDVNIFHTHYEVYRPERFEEISTIVVDHSMPGMTGLELCQQVRHPNIQKILLTGVADEHIAIQAFNEGIINHYIRKQDLNMVEQLNQAIAASQWRYFNKLSEVVVQAVAASDIKDHALLDPNFHTFFKKAMEQNKFTEAYLCESMGSYLFLNEEAKHHGLVVNREDQLDIWVNSGETLNVDPGLLKELKERKKMMCYHNRHGVLEPAPKDWGKHAHLAQSLQGKQGTYYYVMAPQIFDVDTARILPFEDYRAGKKFHVTH